MENFFSNISIKLQVKIFYQEQMQNRTSAFAEVLL